MLTGTVTVPPAVAVKAVGMLNVGSGPVGGMTQARRRLGNLRRGNAGKQAIHQGDVGGVGVAVAGDVADDGRVELRIGGKTAGEADRHLADQRGVERTETAGAGDVAEIGHGLDAVVVGCRGDAAC